jgi:membrane fusion protein, heavy metal efflux system
MQAFLKSGLVAWILTLALLAPAAGRAAADHDEDHTDAPVAAGETTPSHSDGEEEHEEHGGEHGEELVRLSPETLEEFDIALEVAASGSIVRSVALPAEVRPNQDRLAHIAPRFPGIVKEVRKRIGDAVRPKEVLAVIESSESLAPYTLKSDIGGVIIARHVTRGEPVSRETQAFVVANLSDVWVDISVYQNHLRLLRLGQPVLVSAGHDLEKARGEISYISPVVDEETRTATARVVLPNPEGLWRPGMFVTARVEVRRDQVSVVVPATAIELIDDRAVIFVSNGEGFEPRRVELGRSGGNHFEVLSGLVQGERYVSRGGFTLKAELARDELAGGHGH